MGNGRLAAFGFWPVHLGIGLGQQAVYGLFARRGKGGAGRRRGGGCARRYGFRARRGRDIGLKRCQFGGKGGLTAMQDSFRACLHNLLAILVFYVLLFIALFALSIGIQLLAMIVQLVAGPAVGMIVSNLLLMAVLMPVMAGAVYYAWRQMLGGGVAVDPAVMPSHLEA